MSITFALNPAAGGTPIDAASGGDAAARATDTIPENLHGPFGGMVTQSATTSKEAAGTPLVGNEAVQAHCREFFPLKLEDADKTKATIQSEIDDPSTAPDMKAGLQSLLNVMNGNHPSFTEPQKETISVLQRHRDAFPIKMDKIQEKIDDEKTPPDLKAALIQVRDDPTLALALDSTNKGGGMLHCDGTLSDRDLDRLGELPEMQEFNEAKAKNYVNNYIPSDADPSQTDPRAMTADDAAREFYLYSDNLPGHLSQKELKDIVDGTAHCKKCPPQVLAAAQFYRDHPDEWAKVTGGDDKKLTGCSRSHLLDNISKSVYLNTAEKETLDTIDKNRDAFFGSGVTRDSLTKMVDDPAAKENVKKAARKLLDDPLLFGMLDNGKNGHSSNLIKSADDGKIGEADFDAFREHLTTKDKKQPPLPPTHKARTLTEKSALPDMQAGQVDDPELKKEKGGGLVHFMRNVISPFLKAGEMIGHAVSIALSVLTKIPIIGEIAAGLSIAAESMAGGLHIANAGIKGDDMKKAAIAAGAGIAGALVGLVVTGAGPAIARGITAGVEHVAMATTAKAAVTAGERGAAKGATTTAERAAAKAAVSAGDESATKTGGIVVKSEGSDQAKRKAKEEAMKERKDELKDEATNGAIDSGLSNNNNNNNNNVNAQIPGAAMMGPEYDAIIAQAEAEAAGLKSEAARQAEETAARNKVALADKDAAAKTQKAAEASLQSAPNPDGAAAAAA